MAAKGKVLKTSVQLDAKDVFKTLDQIQRKINALHNVNHKQILQQEKVRQATFKTQLAEEKVTTQKNKTAVQAQKVAEATTKAQIAEEKLALQTEKTNLGIDKMKKSLQSSDSILTSMWRKMKGMAATYLGIMGMRSVINTSDTITSSENRLNALNGNNTQMTQQTMDKMYTSAQKVRMDYADMMSNVSKSMTLAGKSFDGNIDNAIRFQEIMSEAYTLGGASAAEKSSSMYQMIQALGAGTLAGDELRSVREGAPLAYKAIEEFAQGVLNTEESLKDLASQGKITSDMVVAAIMDAGETMDEKFKQTSMTFAEAGNIIKNAAIKSFEPALQKLNDLLNSDAGKGFIAGLTRAFQVAGVIAEKLIDIFSTVANYIAKNWYWLQAIFYGIATAIAASAISAGVKMFASFVMGLSPLSRAIILISLVVAALVWMAEAAGSLCEFIHTIAISLGNAIIAILIAVLVVYLATGTIMLSIPMIIGLMVVAVIAWILAVFIKFTGEIIGKVFYFCTFVQVTTQNILAMWRDMTNGMKATFWDSIADMLEGCEWLINGINKIRQVLGKEAITVEGLRAKANSYKNSGGVQIQDPFAAANAAYDRGYAIGTGIQNKINSWGESFSSSLKEYRIHDELNLSELPNTALDASDVNDLLGDIGDGVGKTAGNTGKMADSLDLAKEDLEYLRKLAELEWKQEYTTNTIKIDMSNYNTVNHDSDLDGIVTKLTDKLYEELEVFADGVYV